MPMNASFVMLLYDEITSKNERGHPISINTAVTVFNTADIFRLLMVFLPARRSRYSYWVNEYIGREILNGGINISFSCRYMYFDFPDTP